MAVVDIGQKTITLKIVYYGCALGGKTTNLQTLHRLTDPSGQNGLVSIATNDDRTLFFDLLPMNLGQVGGLSVKVKLYTVPGQVHYELTRRQVLAGADGVILVVDSTPTTETKKANAWAVDNLRFNLRKNGLDPERLPMAIQWNKRDVAGARPIADLRKELNPRGLPEIEAVATNGAGIVETFRAVLTKAIAQTYLKNGRPAVPEEQIEQTIGKALEQATSRQPGANRAPLPAVEHRFDLEAYGEDRTDSKRDRRVLDQETLLAEAVNTNMMLAEKLDGFHQTKSVSECRAMMIESLSRLAGRLADPAPEALPPGVIANLLQGAGRRRGSLLLQRSDESIMEEREVIPSGGDPLNDFVAPSLGSVAHQLSQNLKPRVIEDLASEIFFGAAPAGSEDLTSVLVVPLVCDGSSFGAFFVYVRTNEPSLDDTEIQYWVTAAQLIGLSQQWKALRRKLTVTTP